MNKALSLAKLARGKTSPNPMVGALVVKNGRVVSSGYHRKAGSGHAEVIALDRAGNKAGGATLYVNLEPCCHKDKRTPPCTDRIISSGIKKAVIAMTDPNPKVSGKGAGILKKAGIEVTTGVLQEEAKELNEFYIKHITTGMPFTIMKVAMTLDGKIATPEGQSKWITGEKSRYIVHKLRGSVDAIMTAIGTVSADDPQLTARISGIKTPKRIIIDPLLKISPEARILKVPPETVIVTKTKNKKAASLSDKGVSFIFFKNRLRLKWLLKKLGKTGIMSLLVEGGSSLNSYCLEAGIVDKVMFFIAPKIIGGKNSYPAVGGNIYRKLQQAHRLRDIKINKTGEDILIQGYIRS